MLYPQANGCRSIVNLSGIWEFSLDAYRWRKLRTTSTPPAGRNGHAMIVDAPRRRFVLFGGSVSGLGTAETWQCGW